MTHLTRVESLKRSVPGSVICLTTSLLITAGLAPAAWGQATRPAGPASPQVLAEPEVAAAQQTLAQASERIAELESRIGQSQKAQDSLSQRLSHSDIDLSARHQALDDADASLAHRRQVLENALADLSADRTAFEANCHDAIARFESSNGYRTAREQSDAARAAAATAEDAAKARLAATGAYQRALASATDLQTKASALTTRPVDDPDRADAEQTAHEATARLNQLTARYLDEDPAVKAARSRSQTAGAAFDAMRCSFGKQLPSLPQVVAGRELWESAESRLPTAEKAIAESQATRDRLAAEYKAAADALAADRANSDTLQSQLNDLTAQLAQARSQKDQAQSSFDSAIAAAAQGQQATIAFGPPPQSEANAPQAQPIVPPPTPIDPPPPVAVQPLPQDPKDPNSGSAPALPPTAYPPVALATPQPVCPQAYAQVPYSVPTYAAVPVYVQTPYCVSPPVVYGPGIYTSSYIGLGFGYGNWYTPRYSGSRGYASERISHGRSRSEGTRSSTSLRAGRSAGHR